MAEENPSTISAHIGGQTFSLSTGVAGLIIILLIASVVVGVFLLSDAFDKRLATAAKILQERLDRIEDAQGKVVEALLTNRQGTHDEAQRILKGLAILQHNLANPDQQLPLGLNGLPVPTPPVKP